MRAILLAICLTLVAGEIAFGDDPNDPSDHVMPDVVKKAQMQVEVMMEYRVSTGACFPDSFAKVRMLNGQVMISDLELYPNMQASLSEGLVAFQKGLSWGACDKRGQIVITPQFESPFAFYAGLAAVSHGGKYGFIDKSGRWVIKPAYDGDKYIGNFVGAACPVRIGGKNAVINRKGEYLWQPGLLQADIVGGGILISTTDGKQGFLDDTGALIPGGKPNPNFHIDGN